MAKIPVDADILEPWDDHIFKAILTHPGAEKALISLLTAVLGRTVTAVHIRNNELQASDDNEKNERLDVNCVVGDKTQVNVEMQALRLVEETDDAYLSFINKYIYYMTDLHSSQKSKGVKYHDLVRTYQVTFCMHPVFPNRPDFVNRVALRHPDGEDVSDQINMVVVEMSKISDALKKPPESLTLLEMWSVFFKYAPDPEHRGFVNQIIQINEEVGMASTLLMEISKDEDERAKFRSRRKYETDLYSNIATAEGRGERRGREEGKIEGALEKAWEIAKGLKEDGVDTAIISRRTGLTVDDISKL